MEDRVHRLPLVLVHSNAVAAVYSSDCMTWSGCWGRRDNRHGWAGRGQRNINSVSACQSACLSQPSCVAIDYNPSNRYRVYCWLLSSTLTGYMRGITNYYIINRRLCSGQLHIYSRITYYVDRTYSAQRFSIFSLIFYLFWVVR